MKEMQDRWKNPIKGIKLSTLFLTAILLIVAVLFVLGIKQGLTPEQSDSGGRFWLTRISFFLLLATLVVSTMRAYQQFIANWIPDVHLRRLLLAAWVTALFILFSLSYSRLDPYVSLLIFVSTWAIMAAVYYAEKSIGVGEALAWLALWIPLDLRWSWLQGQEIFDYNWWAIAVAAIAIWAWQMEKKTPAFQFGFRLDAREWSLIAITAIIAAAVIAVGMYTIQGRVISTGFVMVEGVRALIAIAIPEEILFRGILFNRLAMTLENRNRAIWISSVVFGLMHWNNVEGLALQIITVFVTGLAGLYFTRTYINAGNRLYVPVILHALFVLPLLILGR